MRSARSVLNAIGEVEHIYARHPALCIRMSRANCTPADLSQAFDLYLAGISTRWWFCGERRSYLERKGVNRSWLQERSRRRAAGKRQRRARKANRHA